MFTTSHNSHHFIVVISITISIIIITFVSKKKTPNKQDMSG